ncbi:hypothetical protein NDU88_000583 [Pleurodeles waltl]|uniref:Receptor ligand binding region domain-containing protein n=1 Tax=Pleurodeles waltl TaxID=8319 RepID=A0AAV7KMG5_PLEWA|nr:hypothetical protein NDU88_000583 [Pleurodeles waltl]
MVQCEPCRFGFQNYQWIQAMIFAIEEINNNPEILPNITLGFQIYDSCTMLQRSLKGTLWILAGQEEPIPNYRCQRSLPPAAIIGDSLSTRSILLARILGLYKYPQISYFSTSPLLNDRNQFPSFFRTIPSDDFQSHGLAQLLIHFGWTWVGILAADDDYGQQGSQIVQQEIIKAGACVAFTEKILPSRADKNAVNIVKVIKSSTAKAIVIFSSNVYLVPLLDEVLRQNVTGMTWIASEAWATYSLLSIEKYFEIVVGTIGFAIHSGDMMGFQEYFVSIHPSTSPGDTFVRNFWEEAFGCQWTNEENPLMIKDNKTKVCTGSEDLNNPLINNMMDFRLTYNIYNAVYATALALEDLRKCRQNGGPFHHGTCADISDFHSWQLLHYVKKVRLQREDKKAFFDEHGNPPARYDIVNWQRGPVGTIKHVKVGSYDSSAPLGKTLNINGSAVQWITGKKQLIVDFASILNSVYIGGGTDTVGEDTGGVCMAVVEASASKVCVLLDVVMMLVVDDGVVHAGVSVDGTGREVEEEEQEGDTVEIVDVGDSGYPNLSWLLTPLRNARTRAEERYNEAHGRTRRIIERTFGLLKARFRCLHLTGGSLCYSPKKVCQIIVACCMLHNLALRHRVPFLQEEEAGDAHVAAVDPVDSEDEEVEDEDVDNRTAVIRQYFQ